MPVKPGGEFLNPPRVLNEPSPYNSQLISTAFKLSLRYRGTQLPSHDASSSRVRIRIMSGNITTVQEYLNALPEDRREAISQVRNEILKSLPEGYEEGIQWGDISYFVPYSIYPDGYDSKPKERLQYIGLTNRKNNMMIRLVCMYTNPELRADFEEAYHASGKKLDMGDGCLRFKKVENLPMDVLAKLVAQLPVDKFVASYDKKRKEARKK